MKKYTDLEVDQLMDMVTGCLRCTYCHSELTEELTEHSSGQNDTRSLMAKFNDQIEPIYALLRKVEDIRLSSDILEPEPTDYKPPRSSTGQFSVDSRGGSMWSGELTRNTAGFGYSENQVTIALDAGSTGAGSKADVRPVKEVPVWMAHSTVDTLDHTDRQLQQIQTTDTSGVTSTADNRDDIMRTLLSHEKSSLSTAPAAVGGAGGGASTTQSSSSDSDVDEVLVPAYSAGGDVLPMDSDEDVDMSDVEMTSSMTVTVGDQSVPLSELTDEMIARMSAREKDEYIRLGRQLYDQFNH